jgi:nucleoside 2-deoxyribosyltransferase
MICGDENYSGIFPRRSSSYLTEFFHNIDLDYAHDGSTRKWWVRGVLDTINKNGTFIDEKFPSKEMISVIEQLLNPIEYSSSSYITDYEKAVEMVNNLLHYQNLSVSVEKSSGKITINNLQGDFISTATDSRRVVRVITFCPDIFKIPNSVIKNNLVSVMMPFNEEFREVHDSIRLSCSNVGLECLRVDDIWKNSVIIQDVFELIFSSSIVIADLSHKNPNVFYEVGIAHTLGKPVIPIAQNIDDIPFDLRHHRVLTYHDNSEGRETLRKGLEARLITLKEDILLKQNKI